MSTCIRIEKHLIKGSKELDKLAFLSKNLYNRANYLVRQMFIESAKQKEQGLVDHATILNFYTIDKQLQGIEEFKSLPSQTKQSILRLLDKNWKGFIRSIKDYMKNRNKYTGKPGLPKYLDKQGRHILIYPSQNLNIKEGKLRIPKTNINIQTQLTNKELKELRIIPLGNKNFKVELIHERSIQDLQLNKNHVLGIDIGLNNLMAITPNQTNSFSCLVNGRPLKSINQFFNKTKSQIQSTLKKVNDKNWSNRLTSLTLKRTNKIDDYLHKVSHQLIQLCKEFNVGRIVIGHNDSWKTKINLGKKTNQNFVQIPFNRLIQMIQYKSEECDIQVDLVEESYTSKCDHLSGETMEHHDSYLGKRVKRGLFQSSIGLQINSDLNGALGILRKANVACEDFLKEIVASRGSALEPLKLRC